MKKMMMRCMTGRTKCQKKKRKYRRNMRNSSREGFVRNSSSFCTQTLLINKILEKVFLLSFCPVAFGAGTDFAETVPGKLAVAGGRERGRDSVCMCVCVCVRERESVCVCVKRESSLVEVNGAVGTGGGLVTKGKERLLRVAEETLLASLGAHLTHTQQSHYMKQ